MGEHLSESAVAGHLHGWLVGDGGIAPERRGDTEWVYIAERSVEHLSDIRPGNPSEPVGDFVDIQGVNDLETLLRELWPALFRE